MQQKIKIMPISSILFGFVESLEYLYFVSFLQNPVPIYSKGISSLKTDKFVSFKGAPGAD